MKIVVCIKQVPDTADISWTDKNTIKRDGMESVINPFDEFALETAFRIKDKMPDTTITVLSMGPMQASEMLKNAVARGADRAILLSDKKFAGSDTYATSKTLASAIRTKLADFDLILCGQFATDGDTGQTGAAIATHLGIPSVTFVNNIIDVDKNSISVIKQTEKALCELKIKLPALVCLIKPEYELRPALIGGYIKAQKIGVDVLRADDISLTAETTGMKASPTYVCAAFRPEQKKECQLMMFESDEEKVDFLLNKIDELKRDFFNE